MGDISLDGIMDMFRPIIPQLSYFVNILTKLFNIMLSYLGITLPETETTQPDAEEIL